MPNALSIDERFARAEKYLAEAKQLAESVTAEMPGRRRGATIVRTRSYYGRVYSMLSRIHRLKDASSADMLRAAAMLDDAAAQVRRARKFSR